MTRPNEDVGGGHVHVRRPHLVPTNLTINAVFQLRAILSGICQSYIIDQVRVGRTRMSLDSSALAPALSSLFSCKALARSPWITSVRSFAAAISRLATSNSFCPIYDEELVTLVIEEAKRCSRIALCPIPVGVDPTYQRISHQRTTLGHHSVKSVLPEYAT